MKILIAIAGAVFVAFVFSQSKTIGALLLIIIVLGLWLTAQRAGMITDQPASHMDLPHTII